MNDHEIQQLFRPLFTDLNGFNYLVKNRPRLAHYTSVQVLESILKHEELWFSNPLFMNDLEEMRFGIHQGIMLFDQLRGEIMQAAGSLERFQAIESAFMGFYRQFEDAHALDVYVFCVSEHMPGDMDGVLSMWRAYGGNGNGAALVFKTDFLTEPNKESPLLIGKVYYASREQRRTCLKAKLRNWCDILAANSIPTEKLHFASHNMFTAIKMYALTAKHRGFREENEWRLIYFPDHDRKGLMKNCFNYIIGRVGVEPKLRFKIEPLKVGKPEVWTFDSILKHIILGPSLSSVLARMSIVRMLEIIGKGDFGPRVISSSIPSRPS